MNFFIAQAWADPFFFFAWAGVIAFSICVHEFAHAWMALRCGDDTAAQAGHLSLNPLRQMGPGSLLALLLVGIAWGAVPVNPRQFRGRAAAAVVSFAGPAANLLLALLGGALAIGLTHFDLLGGRGGPADDFFRLACQANAVLFIFNLLPVPLFDGWSVCSLLFPPLQDISAGTAQNITWLFLIAVFATPAGNLVWQAGLGLERWLLHGWSVFFTLFGAGAG